MATCRDVIYRAFRVMGVVSLDDVPEASETSAGLSVLRSIYDRIADERNYTPIKTTGDVEAAEGQRIITDGTVTLPTSVIDAVDGQPRAPKDLSFIQYDAGSGWLSFLSDRGSWVALDDLEEGTEAPLSARNSEGLSCLIALEMHETYPGAAIGPMAARKARKFQSMFSRDETQEPEYY